MVKMKVTFLPVEWRRELDSDALYGYMIPDLTQTRIHRYLQIPDDHEGHLEYRHELENGAKILLIENLRAMRDELNQLDLD